MRKFAVLFFSCGSELVRVQCEKGCAYSSTGLLVYRQGGKSVPLVLNSG